MRSASFGNSMLRMLRGLVRGTLVLALLLGLVIAAELALRNGLDVLTGVPRVVDGDTIELEDTNIRLAGLDAPERSQRCTDGRGDEFNCGRAATDYLRFLTREGTTTCRGRGRDRYDRMIGQCRSKGVNLSEAMIERGWAVAYLGDYEAVEARARENGLGLWEGEFTAPAEWRKARRATAASPYGVIREIAGDLSALLRGEARLTAPADE